MKRKKRSAVSAIKLTNTQEASENNLKVLIVGPSGSGKTALAGTIEEQTLFVAIEPGTLSLRSKNIPVFDLSQEQDVTKRYKLIHELYSYLKTPEAQSLYKWIYIDSLTELSQIIVSALKKKYPDRKDGMVMWGEYNDNITAIIKAFRDLPNYHIVFTALQATDKDENGRRYYGVDMAGSIANRVDSLFDEVFTIRVFEDEKGVTKRALLTEKRDSYLGKDRSGKLDQYEQTNLSAIKQKILS